jgi:hypothetical protein
MRKVVYLAKATFFLIFIGLFYHIFRVILEMPGAPTKNFVWGLAPGIVFIHLKNNRPSHGQVCCQLCLGFFPLHEY